MVSFGCSIYWHLYCLSIESHRHHYMRYYWRVHSIGTFKLIQAAMIWSTYSFQFAGVLFFVFFLKEASRRSSSFVRDFEDVRFQKIEWISIHFEFRARTQNHQGTLLFNTRTQHQPTQHHQPGHPTPTHAQTVLLLFLFYCCTDYTRHTVNLNYFISVQLLITWCRALILSSACLNLYSISVPSSSRLWVLRLVYSWFYHQNPFQRYLCVAMLLSQRRFSNRKRFV